MIERYFSLYSQQQLLWGAPPVSASTCPAQYSSVASISSTAGSETFPPTSSPMVQSELDSPASTGTYDLPEAAFEFAAMSSANTSFANDCTVMASSTDADLTDEKLCALNREIKTTLTDLLNCEATQSDEELRSWVLKKLMETELELKQQRKGRGRVGGGQHQRGCRAPLSRPGLWCTHRRLRQEVVK